MTEKTDNELIAEFHNGITFSEDGLCTDPEQKYSWRPGCYDPLRVEHLNYHKSWDWLMPVYRKFKDHLNAMERPSKNHCCKGDMIEVDIHCAVTQIDISKAHKFLVGGIKWYNGTQQP